jgi:DNA sulfur modification protein DndD
VELRFLHDGHRFLVRRAIEGKKLQDDSLQLPDSDEFIMMRTGSDGQTKPVDNPIGTMNAILPVNVREYFLFDGEKIDNFAKPESSRQVKDAIYLVLKLEILDRAARHLEEAAKEYRKELRQNSGGELRALVEKEEASREERDKHEARKAELDAQIKLARKQITDIDQRLRDAQATKLLQERRDQYTQDLEHRRSELYRTINKIRDLATGGYALVARGAVEKLLAILDAARERGEIPSHIRQQFVQDLVEQMQCICGRPINEGSPEHQRLVNLMQKSIPSSLENDVINTTAALRALEERNKRDKHDLEETGKRRVELLAEIDGLEGQLSDVRRQLKDSPSEELSRLEDKRESIEADISSYTLEIGSLNTKIERLNHYITQLNAQIAKARKEESRLQFLSKKLELTQQSADAIKEIYNVFADTMRQKIEEKTKEIFKQLVWKESHFQDVRLDKDFNLEVIDRYGKPMRPELSAGERQVLSLSFITAMSRVSDEEAPLVMDTPFGRLSSHHRDTITRYLPQLADQLILFVTDEELRDKARENLQNRIGAEYRLEFKPDTSCTEIVEVR